MEIAGRLGPWPEAAPFGVNLIVNKSNQRLAADLDIVVRHKVPLVITSLGAVRDVVDAVHSYGGLVFHDVINRRHAEKASEAGVDGIIAVSAGAGGHTGTMSPFALVAEIREVFGGTIVLGGAISTGRHIAAARMMGADLAYLGTRFMATREALAPPALKDMIVASRAADIIHTPNVTEFMPISCGKACWRMVSTPSICRRTRTFAICRTQDRGSRSGLPGMGWAR